MTGRRTSGLLILSALVMTGRTVLAVASDSTFLYFLQPVIGDSLVALAFGLSLATARPLVARLAGDFYPMDQDLHLRPRVRRLFRHLTVLWAVIAVVKASLALWLLESMSLETFVLLKSVGVLALTGAAIVATVMAAAQVARAGRADGAGAGARARPGLRHRGRPRSGPNGPRSGVLWQDRGTSRRESTSSFRGEHSPQTGPHVSTASRRTGPDCRR